jgi:hypothetical protein
VKQLVGVLAAVLALAAASAANAFPTEPDSGDRPGLRTKNTRLIAHLPLKRGFNGDIWHHRDTVYIGGWGRTAGHCPAHGVRVIDVDDPAEPRLLSRFARLKGTTSEDVWVGEISTASFEGDVAVVGIQLCDTSFEGMAKAIFRGLLVYDVTNPLRPTLLSRVTSGRVSHGVHELSAVQRADGRVLVLESTPRMFEMNDGAMGDVRIIEITNPRRPRELTDWDVRHGGAIGNLVRERGQDEILAHSAWPFAGGKRMFVSHWDGGAVFVDISNPRRPRYLSRTSYRVQHEGNAHSGWFSADETLFIQNDEVYRPSKTFPRHSRQKQWGYQRFFDLSNPKRPRALSTFATENTVAGVDGRIPENGYYSVHNNVVVGGLEYASWYSDGVRIVDLSTPTQPEEVGFFVPPPHPDPEGFIEAPDGKEVLTMVWGVAVGDEPDIVYASDINSGLWIFRVLAP